MPGRVEIHHVESSLLEGNQLGDPSRRRVPVYLPPGYDEEDRDYPVLYALAGFTGSGLSFLNYDWYQESLPARLDRLIEDASMPPVAVVMVDGMTRVGGNQYIDSPAVGRYASHIVKELVPWAEQTFRLKPGRDHRGVFGKSSGGYGSLMMAIEHSDVFGAAASHSGDSYFQYCYAPDFPKAADGLRSVGGLDAFMEKLRAWPKFPGKLFHTLNIVAMSHFYSPNDDAPHRFDLPFDEATGERREDVFERWLERDPVQIVGRHADELKTLRLLWIECGSKDEWNLHHGARILSARLKDLGVPHEHAEFEDDHKSLNYRYDETLPKLAAALQ
ncbi:MAG: alpha/beta hydrolase-fold protein [Planctomycetota bacterium]|nr:alpha/beta hydrolase-fold protein [Planctomycetota bacterium]